MQLIACMTSWKQCRAMALAAAAAHSLARSSITEHVREKLGPRSRRRARQRLSQGR